MANKDRNKKTSEEIKEAILKNINECPQTAQDIALGINSNWKTVKEYLKELIEEGKVKEIIATEKISYYKRTPGDTYFDLPITEEQRKKFKTLFHIIKESYKKHNKPLTNTHLAKCTVHVIKKGGIDEIKDLPLICYLYGIIPQMAPNLSEEYSKEYPFKEEKKITKKVNEFVLKNKSKKSEELQKEQHEEYGLKLHLIFDELFEELNKKDPDSKKINQLLGELFIECPIDPEFPEISEFSDKFVSLVNKISYLEIELKEYKKELLTTLDSLWRLIALYYLYKSKTEGLGAMKKKIILTFYLGEAIEDRKRVFQESFSELDNIYKENLIKTDLSKINLSEGAKEVSKIMEDFV